MVFLKVLPSLCLFTTGSQCSEYGSRMYSPVGLDWSTDEDQGSFHSLQPGCPLPNNTLCSWGVFLIPQCHTWLSASQEFSFPLAALSPAFRELLLSVHQGHGVILLSPLQSSAFGGSLPCTVCPIGDLSQTSCSGFQDSAHEPSTHFIFWWWLTGKSWLVNVNLARVWDFFKNLADFSVLWSIADSYSF